MTELEQTLQNDTMPEQQEQQQEEHVDTDISQAPQQQEQQQQLSNKELNFKELREQKERLQKERDELMRQLEMQKAQQNQQDDDDKDLHPDDLVEWRHVDKKIRRLEQQISQQHKQIAESAIEARLKVQYPDFDAIVNNDTIAALQTAYPEIAATLGSSKDLYTKAVSAYTLIKKLGIRTGDEQSSSQKNIINSNLSKPRPAQSVSPQQGATPLSRANEFAQGLTEDRKKQIYREMLEAARSR